MAVSLSHHFFVMLLRLTGGRKILGKQFIKGQSATASPKQKDISKFGITQSGSKDNPIWTYVGNETLVYYLHGGGFVLGFSPLYFPMMGGIAKASNATLVAPDYPLPPDQTAMKTHIWIREHFLKTVKMLKPKHIVIMGDSAGGNLAIGLCQWLSTSNNIQANKLILLAPWVDLEMQNPAMVQHSGEQLLVAPDLRKAALRYAGKMDIKDPLISPLFANHLDLPKTYIFTGDQDLLHPDIISFAAKYPEAELDIAKDMPHVYMLMPTKEAKAAFKRIAAAVND